MPLDREGLRTTVEAQVTEAVAQEGPVPKKTLAISPDLKLPLDVGVDGCLSCPFVHQPDDEPSGTWCAHPKWAEPSQWLRHGGLRTLRLARSGRHTYPPKWCPLRALPALVSLSKKGRRVSK